MKRPQISQKLLCGKFHVHEKKNYMHEIAAVNLSKIYFLKNAKKTCKPNNGDLNRDWITFNVTFNILMLKKLCSESKSNFTTYNHSEPIITQAL